MRLVEFYKQLQSIIESYHLREMDEDEASEQLDVLIRKGTEAGLEVSVKPSILKKIEVAEEETSYNSYEDDEDNY